MKKYNGEYVLVRINENTWKTHNMIEGEVIAYNEDSTELYKLIEEKGYNKNKVYTTYIPYSGECIVR